MVGPYENRWPSMAAMPARIGFIDDIDKFDATFFGVPYKQVNRMDPQGRMLIECAYEAVLDAGVCPRSIRGSRTAVLIGTSSCDSDDSLYFNGSIEGGLGITG